MSMLHPCHHALSRPDHPAYIMAETGETVSYRQLDERSNQFAHLLRAKGLQAGDHIVILLENHARFFELCWGAQRAGIVFTAISTRLKLAEAAYIVTNCEAKLIVASRAQTELAEALLPHLGAAPTRLMVDGTVAGYEPLETALAMQPTVAIADETAGTDMLYSSGTTGYPKGVFVPPESPQIDASNALIEVCSKLYQIGEATRYLSPAPLYHAAPLRFCMTTMRLGGTCIIMAHFDPEAYLALVQSHRITHTQLVPTMFVRMLKLPQAARATYDLSSLRFAIHAAAPCAIPVKEQMIAWWGEVIWEYYAGTEGNGMTLVKSSDWLLYKGTVGQAVIGKVKICDEEGEEVALGQTGAVYFADGKKFTYHQDPSKTAQSHNAKGWSTLGDIGHVDADGYLYLTDRKAYMIISGGVNIYPQEVENLLITHPKVFDVAVLGVPDDEFGEAVKAVVQPIDMRLAGVDLAEELMAFCRKNLSHVKCPKSVDFDPELPRHPTGKLYKRLLRERYWPTKT
jgi:long-chain acyl-CoA synthetase